MTRRVRGHHIIHWADGGPTNLSNGCLLCSWHHWLVHEGGYRIRGADDGRFLFLRPDGTTVSAPVAPYVIPGDGAIRAANRHLGIDENTNRCRWDGDEPDYDTVVAYIQRHQPDAAAS